MRDDDLMSEPLVRELDDTIKQMECNLHALKDMAAIIIEGQRANDYMLGRLNGLTRYVQNRLVADEVPAVTDEAAPSEPEAESYEAPPQEKWSETISRINRDMDAMVHEPPAIPPHFVKVAKR